MKRRHSSVDSFNAADFDMNTIWPDQALERTATRPTSPAGCAPAGGRRGRRAGQRPSRIARQSRPQFWPASEGYLRNPRQAITSIGGGRKAVSRVVQGACAAESQSRDNKDSKDNKDEERSRLSDFLRVPDVLGVLDVFAVQSLAHQHCFELSAAQAPGARCTRGSHSRALGASCIPDTTESDNVVATGNEVPAASSHPAGTGRLKRLRSAGQKLLSKRRCRHRR